MLIRPYGDTRDDGIIQFSFTLPMPYSVKAADVGKQFLEKLGFHTVGVAECKAIDPEYTLFVAYGRTDISIDPDEVKGDYLEVEEMDYYAINALIKERLGRRLSVVGAAIESDSANSPAASRRFIAGSLRARRLQWRCRRRRAGR